MCGVPYHAAETYINRLIERGHKVAICEQVEDPKKAKGLKVIITGDASQKDLPRDATSGLDVAMKVLKKIDDIGFCQLTSKDVVRHPLVQQIVQAYDAYEKKQKPERPARRRNGVNER